MMQARLRSLPIWSPVEEDLYRVGVVLVGIAAGIAV